MNDVVDDFQKIRVNDDKKNHNCTALYLDEWMQLARDTPGVMITLKDILDMKPGETKHFLCIDRNFDDVLTYRLSKYNKLLKKSQHPDGAIPTKLFADNYQISFTKSDHLPGPVGKWIHRWVTYRTRLNKTKRTEGHHKYDLRALEIEYAPGCWYPLEVDGCLRPDREELDLMDRESKSSRLLHEAAGKHYSSYPSNTRVGWRGPLINYDWLLSAPNVIYNSSVSHFRKWY